MRLFVAVELDDVTRDAVREEQQLAANELGRHSSLRLIDPQQVHLTLVFLGEVQAALVEPLTDLMTQPIDGTAPFRLRIGGLGVFPPHGAPRVLWLGLTDGARQMSELHRAVAARVAVLRIPLEDRAFRPHLTIGRWRHARPGDRPRFRHTSVRVAAEMTVDRVTLFESRLSSQGASHFPLAHAPLSATTAKP
jgi:RNA 2',3'-cyclic 3'-phosphodiesterase